MNNKNEGKAARYYIDPRARRLQANAYVALCVVTVPTLFLLSFLVTSRGQLNLISWGAVVAIIALSLGGAVCLLIAPRVEARAAAEYERQLAEVEAADLAYAEAHLDQAGPGVPAERPAFQPVPMPPPQPAVPAAVAGQQSTLVPEQAGAHPVEYQPAPVREQTTPAPVPAVPAVVTPQ